MTSSTSQALLAFPAIQPSKLNSRQRQHRKRKLEREGGPVEATRPPSPLPLNARDLTPSGKGWIRMRQGDWFSQWCNGSLCVKLRTATQPEAVMHYIEIICGHATVERRQGAVLRAFGLSGAVCLQQEVGAARFVLEVKR